MKTPMMIAGLLVVAAAAAVAAGSTQRDPTVKLERAERPEKPDKIETIVQALAARVSSLETSVADIQQNGVTRTVFAGAIDLNGPGDVIRDDVADNIRRVRHFVAFPIAGLTADDPPMISLFQRRRTDGTPPYATTTGFVLSNALGSPASTLGGFTVFLDPTLIVVENGQILVQFKFEAFNPSTLPTPSLVRYGLDGAGGTGEYRLVVVR